MEKDVDLISLARINRDAFYQVIAKFTNSDLRKTCSSRYFSFDCRRNQFWLRLWEINFTGPIPNLSGKELRMAYFRQNRVYSVIEELSETHDPHVGETKAETRHILELLLEGDPSLVMYLALKHNLPETFIYAIQNGANLKEVSNSNSQLIENLLENLNGDEIREILSNLTLLDILNLPRKEKRCSPDLVEIYLEETLPQTFSEIVGGDRISDYLEEGLKYAIKNCPDLVKTIVSASLKLGSDQDWLIRIFIRLEEEEYIDRLIEWGFPVSDIIRLDTDLSFINYLQNNYDLEYWNILEDLFKNESYDNEGDFVPMNKKAFDWILENWKNKDQPTILHLLIYLINVDYGRQRKYEIEELVPYLDREHLYSLLKETLPRILHLRDLKLILSSEEGKKLSKKELRYLLENSVREEGSENEKIIQAEIKNREKLSR